MNATSISRTPLVITLLLAAGMAATRFHHFGSAIHLPDASLAIFFLAGFYLRPALFLPAFLAEAALIDYAAIAYAGVSDWCITPAYGFLIPTYATLWFAGRWYAARHQQHWRTLVPLIGAVTISTTLAFLISNGSFYLFSGRYPDLGWTEYAARVATYFPPYAVSTLMYVFFAAALHAVAIAATRMQTGITFRGPE